MTFNRMLGIRRTALCTCSRAERDGNGDGFSHVPEGSLPACGGTVGGGQGKMGTERGGRWPQVTSLLCTCRVWLGRRHSCGQAQDGRGF
jgi:hypothetical protein